MTGVSECSQQRGSLKDNGYIPALPRSCIIVGGNDFDCCRRGCLAGNNRK
ncbi:hypothetical protein [Photorhabdus laumondii]